MLVVFEYRFCVCDFVSFFFVRQKTAYEMRISDWSSDVCSSDLPNICREPLAPECGEVAVKIVECRVERHHLHPERLGTPRQRRQRRRARRIVVARDLKAFESGRAQAGSEVRGGKSGDRRHNRHPLATRQTRRANLRGSGLKIWLSLEG